MSTDKKTQSGQPDDQSDGQGDGKTNNDDKGSGGKKWTQEELEARLAEVSAEAKKERQAKADLRKQIEERDAKLKELEDSKLQEQGKYQEMYQKKKEELDKLQADSKKKDANYAFKIVTSHVKEEALKMGCHNPEHLIKLASAEGLLDELDVDSEFNVSGDSLKAVMEKAQKNMSYLFGKKAPKVHDIDPKNPKAGDGKTDGAGLTLQEKIKKLAEMSR